MLTVVQYCADKLTAKQELVMSDLLIDQELDSSGLLRPFPIIKTKLLMDTS